MGFPEFGHGVWTSYGRMKGHPPDSFPLSRRWTVSPGPTKVVDSQVSPNETLQRRRVKTVPFSAHQRRTVRDCYRMRLGEANWLARWPLQAFSYVLSIGALGKARSGKLV